MADEATPQEPQAQPQQVQPKMQVLGQFIRDMSFENVLSQKGAKGEVKPEMKIEVALDAKKRPTEHQYEVITKFKISSVNQGTEDPVFVLELDYAGIFQIENVPDEQMHPFLLIECPRILFPFVRRIVSDVTRDGGFPPVNLDNVDFVALYRQDLARRMEAQKAASPTN
ncbi:protein-export chaperone SecB [Maritimibacter fusiformis]|jgi:preprotein translocase subunit SecB|uniref:Protein-export protein SecB n=1 Tax=Maritimibacter fusiformis TaxID=2603819 RepID=A0A5D0RA38_9RHOB|nr:protein-export chaperone SecB [Maritimibacter fusiformis]TYB77726.1 protein-export chaperone SecB [Maritimibacter fusiformis]